MATLKQMEYWLAVVEEGSFTRAAQRVHVSQPSLSQQIKGLELEVGGDLLERLPRSVRLTAAGKAFLPHARIALHAADRASRSARNALQLETGELEISTVRSIAVGLIPGMIRDWRQHYPGTFVRLHEYTHKRLAEDAVRQGFSDIGIGPPPLDWSGPVEVLGWEEFLVVLPRTDPLASRRSVPLAALSQRQWVMFEPGHGLYDLIVAACSRWGFKPLDAVTTSQVETAARLAAAGVGPTLVPANTVPEGLDAALVRVDPPLGRKLSLYGRSEWAPLTGAFVELMTGGDWPKPPKNAILIG